MKERPSLAFIGRQYHRKTQSDQLILTFLQQHYDVHMFRREQFTDAELVNVVNNAQPDCVFFWCLPPSSTKHLWKIRCKNIVWAPMWDGFKPLKWRKRWLIQRSKVKVLCFSKALYRYFSSTPISSFYIQCALKPQFGSFKECPPYKLFFWQRQEAINLENIVRLIGEKNLEKVYYKSEIGTLSLPSFSFALEKLPDWLDKEDYEKILAEVDFYIAPRTSEGIGFSFLEAMSRGKVVLGYNESTMNEYIEHDRNGYLFDHSFTPLTTLKSPKELSKYMREKAERLYYSWESKQGDFLEFLKK